MLGSLASMLLLSPLLSCVFLVIVPLTVLVTVQRTRVMRPLFRKRSGKLGELNGYSEEMLSGVRTIKGYGREDEMAITEAQLAQMVNCNLIVESIYNPYETKLLEVGRLHGIKTVSGVELLVSQAMFSFTDAFDIELNASHAAVMKDAVLEYYSKNRR